VTPRLELRIDELSVDLHIEDPSGTGDQLGFDSELLLDRAGQTGGDGIIVSDLAELDGDVHGSLPAGSAMFVRAPNIGSGNAAVKG
jgi:hypothetical protein